MLLKRWRDWRQFRRHREANRWHLCPPRTSRQQRRWQRWWARSENRQAYNEVLRVLSLLRQCRSAKLPTRDELLLYDLKERVNKLTYWGWIIAGLLVVAMVTDTIIRITGVTR